MNNQVPHQQLQPQQQLGPNLLFYGENCPASKQLMDTMRNVQLLQYFKLICVNEHLASLPETIKEVPTLVIPSMHKILGTKESFMWVHNVIAQRRQMMMEQQANTSKNIQQYVIKQSLSHLANGSPLAFVPTEMAGFSDNFAYTTQRDISLPHAFFGFGDEKNNVILTPQVKKGTISESEQKLIENKLKKERDEQEKNLKEMQRIQQINAVIRKEQMDIYAKLPK